MRCVPPISTLQLHNQAMGGKLIPLLRKHPTTGKSYETLAFELRARGVTITAATARRWVQQVTR
jgi:hypothetical protein